MENEMVTVENAVESFIAGSPSIEAGGQAELRRFERWIGKTKSISILGPLDIEHYADRFSKSDPGYTHKLTTVRKFLSYTRDKGWTPTNLAVHLKVKKGSSKASGVTRTVRPEMSVLTRQGYDDVVKELAELKSRRPQVLEEIRRAATDKDFRENAPLHAAREQLGHIDGRIQQLLAIEKSASIIGETTEERDRVAIGDTVCLVDNISGNTLKYSIVGPKEANPGLGKISYISPLGKAVIGKTRGDVVEFAAPAGSRRYKVEQIQKF